MNALDKVALNQTVHHMRQHIAQQLDDLVKGSLFESTPQQVAARCDAYLKDVAHESIKGGVKTIDSQICTQYKIHDTKNRCFVRLMDENGFDIKLIWLKGRRKAHKVGRAQIGALFLAFSVMPVCRERSISFLVKVERNTKTALAGA